LLQLEGIPACLGPGEGGREFFAVGVGAAGDPGQSYCPFDSFQEHNGGLVGVLLTGRYEATEARLTKTYYLDCKVRIKGIAIFSNSSLISIVVGLYRAAAQRTESNSKSYAYLDIFVTNLQDS
jgi:hypothetical protein